MNDLEKMWTLDFRETSATAALIRRTAVGETLKLVGRSDPATALVAKEIVDVAESGIHDR
jgi:hypothetical protein